MLRGRVRAKELVRLMIVRPCSSDRVLRQTLTLLDTSDPVVNMVKSREGQIHTLLAQLSMTLWQSTGLWVRRKIRWCVYGFNSNRTSVS